MIGLQVFGVEATAEYLKDGIRLFKLEQRKKMRDAANLVKRDVIAKVASVFPSNTTPHKRSGRTTLGPLRRSIAVRLINRTADVEALIRPRAKAFYGRFQETGLDVTRKGRNTGDYFQRRAGGRKFVKRGQSKPFHLPRKPFLEPVAVADTSKVVAIMGDAYGVFYRGGA